MTCWSCDQHEVRWQFEKIIFLLSQDIFKGTARFASPCLKITCCNWPYACCMLNSYYFSICCFIYFITFCNHHHHHFFFFWGGGANHLIDFMYLWSNVSCLLIYIHFSFTVVIVYCFLKRFCFPFCFSFLFYFFLFFYFLFHLFIYLLICYY